MSSELKALSVAAPGHALRHLWALEPSMHFLNHGSYGATPRYVLAAQHQWRERMERQPVRFMSDELPAALVSARTRLAGFLATSPERLALVENATAGVNAVLRSIAWQAGDELVLADHAYLAVRHTVHYLAERHGVVVRLVQIEFPLSGPQAILEAYWSAITPRTRLVVVDHIFSTLAVQAPVAEIVAVCQPLGVRVMVDGAHAPGLLPLALDELGADWYVGNCHKWLLAPKGCAFLVASSSCMDGLHPAVISNFHDSGFPMEFDWQGTRDYSAWLAVTAALDFVEAFGAARYRQVLREQAAAAAALLCRHWAVELPAPPAMFSAMVTLPLPGDELATEENAKRWHDRLWAQHRIEVPVLAFNQRLWVRISAQVYNELSDYEALARAVRPL
jgi:isopenicillin-N epimerase